MRKWMIAAAVTALLLPAAAQAEPLVLTVTGARATMQSSCVDCGHGRRNHYLPVPSDQKAYDASHAKVLKDAGGLPPEAVYTQGLELYTNPHYDGDQQFGLQLMEAAGERGHETAQRKLIEVEPDAKKACYWAEQVAQKETPADWLVAARRCESSDDPARQAHALGWYNLAAESGNVDAQLALAERLVAASPIRDVRLGLYWYVRAAESGNVNGMLSAAYLYLGRPGDTDPALIAVRDRPKALEWYRRAGNAGNVYAMQHAGDLYMGLPEDGDPALAALRDPVAAVEWYKRAVVTGNSVESAIALCSWPHNDASAARPEAMATCLELYEKKQIGGMARAPLTYAYFTGNGLPQDYRRAADLAKGTMDPEASYYRGQVLAFGLGAVPAEPNIGWHLIEWAAEKGNPDAQAWLKSHPRPASVAPDFDLATLPTGQYRLSAALDDKTTDPADPAAALVAAVKDAGGDYYPERAADDEVEGSAIIECQWGSNGTIEDCLVDAESPSGYGFGAAAMKMLEHLNLSALDASAWKAAVADRMSIFVVRFWLQ